jgi:cell division protein FtsI/penicillin-binding protein 2
MSPDNFIGQGGMHLTPKQFVKLYLVLANGGKIQDNIRFVEYTITKNGQKKLTHKAPGKQLIKASIVQQVLKMTSDNSF